MACQGVTKAGRPCRNTAVGDDGYCIAHSPRETEGSRRFGGVQPGSGRPRKPRAIDVLKEKVEEQIDTVIAPYFDALASDDQDLRLKAADRLLDRSYGKAAQVVRHQGDRDEPLNVNVNLDDKARKVLGDVLRGRPATRPD